MQPPKASEEPEENLEKDKAARGALRWRVDFRGAVQRVLAVTQHPHHKRKTGNELEGARVIYLWIGLPIVASGGK